MPRKSRRRSRSRRGGSPELCLLKKYMKHLQSDKSGISLAGDSEEGGLLNAFISFLKDGGKKGMKHGKTIMHQTGIGEKPITESNYYDGWKMDTDKGCGKCNVSFTKKIEKSFDAVRTGHDCVKQARPTEEEQDDMEARLMGEADMSMSEGGRKRRRRRKSRRKSRRKRKRSRRRRRR